MKEPDGLSLLFNREILVSDVYAMSCALMVFQGGKLSGATFAIVDRSVVINCPDLSLLAGFADWFYTRAWVDGKK